MINNKSFDNFIVTPQARMRFIERIIFGQEFKLDLEVKLLNNSIKSEVEILKQEIVRLSNWQDKKNPHKEIYVLDYKSKAPNQKHAASISLDGDLILGLDGNGYINTIYHNSW